MFYKILIHVDIVTKLKNLFNKNIPYIKEHNGVSFT